VNGLFQDSANDEEDSSEQREPCFYPTHLDSKGLDPFGERPCNALASSCLKLCCPLSAVRLAVLNSLPETLAEQPRPNYVGGKGQQTMSRDSVAHRLPRMPLTEPNTSQLAAINA
jgi:hypothetical protein